MSTIEETKSYGNAVLFGIIAIFTLAIITSLISALILRFSSVQDTSIQWIITAISFITLFIGGFISGGKGKEKGWLIGGLTGLIYSIIIFFAQYLGYDRIFTTEQFLYHGGYIATAMIGGMMGVNMSSKS